MSQIYTLIFKRIDKYFFYLILVTLVFFIFALLIDIFFTKSLVYIFFKYFSKIEFKGNFTVLLSSFFIIINYMPTLLLYISFGYLMYPRLPVKRASEMVRIASSISFLLMLIVYRYEQDILQDICEERVCINSLFLDIFSLFCCAIPVAGLILGVKLRKKSC